MMIHEFTERTGYEPTFEEYKYIEDSYYEFDGQKDEFCKWWKAAQKSGEWKRELNLRQRLDECKKFHEQKEAEQEELLNWYREEHTKMRDKLVGTEAKLKAIQNVLKGGIV